MTRNLNINQLNRWFKRWIKMIKTDLKEVNKKIYDAEGWFFDRDRAPVTRKLPKNCTVKVCPHCAKHRDDRGKWYCNEHRDRGVWEVKVGGTTSD